MDKRIYEEKNSVYTDDEDWDVSDINTIGFNIKDIRKNRRSEKFTVKYMVSEINKLLPGDAQITEGLYYKWESEERIPTAKHIPAIAKVLGVTETTLFHWQEHKRNMNKLEFKDFSEELMSLDAKRLDSLMWIGMNWGGDTAALIEFALLYAKLSIADRRDIASFGIRLYDICKKEGRLKAEYPEPDNDYLRDALLKLWYMENCN
ncbi:MAG: helix-turn-helix domain-containing protein [Coprococcus sp.]